MGSLQPQLQLSYWNFMSTGLMQPFQPPGLFLGEAVKNVLKNWVDRQATASPVATVK